ncbi:hypothetical protein B9T19_05945 [Ignatzschineria sp. F8392]|nr:hypothetical protein B9T19_05945 [Ignatzschineria sp. F8392]
MRLLILGVSRNKREIEKRKIKIKKNRELAREVARYRVRYLMRENAIRSIASLKIENMGRE